MAILAVCALLAAAVASFYPRSLFTPERLWFCVVLCVVAAVRVMDFAVRAARRRRAIDACVLTTTSSSSAT